MAGVPNIPLDIFWVAPWAHDDLHRFIKMFGHAVFEGEKVKREMISVAHLGEENVAEPTEKDQRTAEDNYQRGDLLSRDTVEANHKTIQDGLHPNPNVMLIATLGNINVIPGFLNDFLTSQQKEILIQEYALNINIEEGNARGEIPDLNMPFIEEHSTFYGDADFENEISDFGTLVSEQSVAVDDAGYENDTSDFDRPIANDAGIALYERDTENEFVTPNFNLRSDEDVERSMGNDGDSITIVSSSDEIDLHVLESGPDPSNPYDLMVPDEILRRYYGVYHRISMHLGYLEHSLTVLFTTAKSKN